MSASFAFQHAGTAPLREIIGFCSVGMLGGLWMFVNGFRRFLFRRRLLFLPVSRVRSIAVGPVQLEGRAVAPKPLIDPIYNQPCAYYRVVVQEKRGSGDDESWTTLYRGDSSAWPFYLDDGTGRVFVFPSGADLHLAGRIHATSSPFGRLLGGGGDPVHRFLLGMTGSGSSLRLEADIVRDGAPVYVYGYAKSLTDLAPPLEPAENEAARKLKADPARMKALDTNHDGVVDADEWDAGVRAVREQLEQERLKKQLERKDDDSGVLLVVDKGPDRTLILSDSEAHAARDVGLGGLLLVVGGPSVALLCAFSLVRVLRLF